MDLSSKRERESLVFEQSRVSGVVQSSTQTSGNPFLVSYIKVYLIFAVVVVVVVVIVVVIVCLIVWGKPLRKATIELK